MLSLKHFENIMSKRYSEFNATLRFGYLFGILNKHLVSHSRYDVYYSYDGADEMKKAEKKKELIKKILFPVMDKKGLSLRNYHCGVWTWEKEVDGIMEEVELSDNGRVYLRIGMEKNDVWPGVGTRLLLKMEHPRTDFVGWGNYSLYPEKGKALYEDILLDIRDILEKYCDSILKENAEGVKKAVPTRKHFEYMRENREHLVEEYREKLGINGQGIVEIYELMAGRIRLLCGQPLEEVEKDLMGYSALLEDEILRQYGGIREMHDEFGTFTITNVGQGVFKRTFNMMVRIFGAWKYEKK